MISALGPILQFMLGFFGEIFDLYTTCAVLSGVFALWVLDRIFGIFDILKR